jgi:hypothetical protein
LQSGLTFLRDLWRGGIDANNNNNTHNKGELEIQTSLSNQKREINAGYTRY